MTYPLHVAFVSLGCAKNLVDSEKMLGLLGEAGFLVAADESDADVMVINTCGFLAAAREEADEVIREAVARKGHGRLRGVVVAGCLPQRDGEAILKRIDGVDALVGVNNRDDVVRAVCHAGGLHADRGPSPGLYLDAYHPYVQLDGARLRITPRHYAYLRINEGCDQACTFCTIPDIRGPMHGKPPEVILAEMRELVGDGAVEIILIGQDTTGYGLGHDGFDIGLAGLLRMLDEAGGATWIRLMYAYPSGLTDEIIEAVAEGRQICKYIDLPLQHINDRVLKAMGRRVTRRQTEGLLQKLRDRIPGVAIRTTLIAGFPGETEAEFEELLEFVRDFRFDALGVFPYSYEPETAAARLKGHVSERIKERRVDALMGVQQDVAFALADGRIGSTFDVLVDELGEEGTVVGRHRGQAPEVDAVTYVEDCDARPGDFVTVCCTGRDTYDLVARPV
jgi:ribosomal protein S12 methylthiotransferase